MALLVGFIIFLFILFCINYAIISYILYRKRKIEARKKPIWEQEVEKEIEWVMNE